MKTSCTFFDSPCSVYVPSERDLKAPLPHAKRLSGPQSFFWDGMGWDGRACPRLLRLLPLRGEVADQERRGERLGLLETRRPSHRSSGHDPPPSPCVWRFSQPGHPSPAGDSASLLNPLWGPLETLAAARRRRCMQAKYQIGRPPTVLPNC